MCRTERILHLSSSVRVVWRGGVCVGVRMRGQRRTKEEGQAGEMMSP